MHHGIDLGDGTVAHYLEGKEIRRSTIKEFSYRETITTVNHHTISSKSLTLKRAISRIGEKRYNLLFNNCEHFANWCKTGFHRSGQMEDFLESTRMGTLFTGKVIPTKILAGLNLYLKKDITDKNLTEYSLKQIIKLRTHLKQKIEQSLNQIEVWINKNNDISEKRSIRKLLLAGQALADEIKSLEILEEKISLDLKKLKPKS